MKKGIMIVIVIFILVITFYSIYSSSAEANEKLLYQEWERSQMLNLKEDEVGILIELNEKTLYVLKGNKVLKTYTIASGKSETPSPIGEWTIVEKASWGGGFGARWLGLNVPWGRYGIHGTNKPGSIGWNVSHGCIRMRNEDVKELFDLVTLNTRVVIRGGPYGAFGNGFRTLVPGDRGQDVMVVQRKLKELGYYQGNIDGIYGIGMEYALNQWQKEKNLPISNKITTDLYKKLGIQLFD
ncbi:L,D-transpeptidase family protein [Garciella nitratireducens]|uniref:L,D-transpeptidase family protein n=1 Tax=Garciella nitratireducens TaxID=218205 RepID=UPI000DEA79CE|nr:L,D-transpeptidase family protein [Garciella nitratireducens]RBP45530.1 putative peptidoglycan binding protein [Garciella nitratireducens]